MMASLDLVSAPAGRWWRSRAALGPIPREQGSNVPDACGRVHVPAGMSAARAGRWWDPAPLGAEIDATGR